MAGSPVLEDKLEVLSLLVGERSRALALQLLVLGGGLEEGAGVGNGIQQAAKVCGQDIRDEPRDRLGTEDDLSSKARGKQETGQDKVDVELKASIVEDKVDAALLLAIVTGLLERVVDGGEVVDENVLLGGLAGLAALHLLDILVCHVGEEREVSGIAPEADFEHFGKEDLFGFNVLGGILALAQVSDKLLVAGSKLDDGTARGAEGVHLLAEEDIIVLPVLGHAEEGADAAVHVALGEEPGDGVPAGVAELLKLLVVGGDFGRVAVVDDGGQRAVVLDLVLEGAELLDNLLAFGLLLGVVGLGDGAVDVVNGASLGEEGRLVS